MNKSAAFVFFGIILVGLAISLFVLKRGGEGGDEAAVPPAEAPAQPGGVAESAAESSPGKAAKSVAPAPPATEPAPKLAPSPVAEIRGLFPNPEAALRALADRIEQRDFEGFAALVGEGGIDEAIRPIVRALVENPDLRLDPDKPRVEISKSAEGLRWALNFVPAAGAGAGRQLYADLVEKEGEGLRIAKVALPLGLSASGSADPSSPSVSKVAGTPGAAPAAGASPGPSAPEPAALASADALTVAHAFSKAVVRRDFRTARALADPASVTDERVAALMIAVEEGNFALREDRPLVVTLSREDITWVLARVQSESAASEFAVELGRIGGAWKVNGLTFSKVLTVLSQAAGGGDVSYSPIIEDPSGGDSLVLYFEFDESGLTPRAERQLAIVAEILNEGEERLIRISGHADALGSDEYNVELSNRRAEAIRQALVGRGVKPAQVVTEAYGAAKPRKPNFLPDGSDNPSGRSENRRAEVFLDF